MSKITLQSVANLENENTAVAQLNSNSTIISQAFDNTLSRDGTSPNQMGAALDMNSNQILNLPAPIGPASPLRLTDLDAFIGGGTISSIPAGGTTGQVLGKSSGTDYAVNWINTVSSVALSLPADFTISNSPVTTTGTLTAVFATTPTGTGGFVRATSPVLVTPALGTPASGVATNLTGTAAGLTAGNVTTNANLTGVITSVGNATSITSQTGTGSKFVVDTSPVLVTPNIGIPSAGTLTSCTGLPISTGVSGLATGVAAFLATPTSANLKTALTDETGSGAAVFASTPTLVTPVLGAATATTINASVVSPGHYTGEPSTGSALSGEIGEYIESVLVSGSATGLVNNIAKTVTSISLTAGDWDVDSNVSFITATTTNVVNLQTSLSLTTNTFDTTPGRASLFTFSAAGFVPTAGTTCTSIVQPYRFSLSTTTTIFIVAICNFTISTLSAYGIIRARRAR